MAHEIIWEAHGVVKRFSGYLSSVEYLAAHHEVAESESMDRHIKYVINDFTGADRYSISEDDLAIYAAERIGIAAYLPDIRGVFVAGNPTMMVLCELIESVCWTRHETRVFQTMAEARAWLKY